MRTKSLSLTLALLLAPTFAVAGGEQGDLDLGLFAGYGIYDDYANTAPGNFNPDEDVFYGLRIGLFAAPRWSAEFSYQRLGSETDFTTAIPNVDADIDSVRLNLLYNFRPEEKVRPFITAGFGVESTEIGSFLDEEDLGLNAGGGVRWYWTDNFGLRWDARYVLADVGGIVDKKQSNIETAVGLMWSFGGTPATDSDGDGVKDRRDKCPGTPAGALVDTTGCPLDGDKDGVPDGIDQCPDTPAGMIVDSRGCPKDTDGDGVFDSNDKCPGTPKGAKVDASGCPLDGDGDGVADGLDRCPDTPRGVPVDASGCTKDSDGDGVHDGLDKCPGTPKGTKVDATGCKIEELKFEAKRKTLVLEGVTFEFNKADLTPGSRTILDRVAKSLNDWPEIRVEVGGHTDSVGSNAYNQKLSAERAGSVMNYLAGKGVVRSRLTAKGYGETEPLNDNSTSAKRDKNRRVELKKLN